MKTSTFFKKTILCIAIGFMTLALSAQITIDNNAGSTTTYQTIQDALDNAPDNATIYVQPSGTSYGAANIFKPVTIVGRSHSEPTKISQIAAVNIRTSGVTVKGILFSSLAFSTTGATAPPPYVGTSILDCEFSGGVLGITSVLPVNVNDVIIRGSIISGTITQYSDGTDVLLSNNIFTGSSPLTIYDPNSIVVANNVFRYQSNFNFYNYSTAGTVILFNNMFITNSGSDRTISFNSGAFNLSNCLTYNFGFGNLTFTSNASGSVTDSNTLLNTNPLFTNVDNTVSQSFVGTTTYNSAFRPEDDLTLGTGSPALTGGGGGSEIGLFNNSFNFEKLGNPRGIPALDIISYDGAVPKNGNINVTISAKSY